MLQVLSGDAAMFLIEPNGVVIAKQAQQLNEFRAAQLPQAKDPRELILLQKLFQSHARSSHEEMEIALPNLPRSDRDRQAGSSAARARPNSLDCAATHARASRDSKNGI